MPTEPRRCADVADSVKRANRGLRWRMTSSWRCTSRDRRFGRPVFWRVPESLGTAFGVRRGQRRPCRVAAPTTRRVRPGYKSQGLRVSARTHQGLTAALMSVHVQSAISELSIGGKEIVRIKNFQLFCNEWPLTNLDNLKAKMRRIGPFIWHSIAFGPFNISPSSS